MREKELEQFQIAGLGCADEWRSSRLEKPLHGEDRPRQGIVLYPKVRIGSVVEQKLDVIEMIEIGLWHWKIPTLDVPIVGGEVQRCPIPFVGLVYVCTMLDKILAELIVPVVGCRKEWSPPIFGGLVDIGSGRQQQLRTLEFAFSCCDYQRSKSAATGSDETRHDNVGVLVLSRGSGRTGLP